MNTNPRGRIGRPATGSRRGRSSRLSAAARWTIMTGTALLITLAPRAIGPAHAAAGGAGARAAEQQAAAACPCSLWSDTATPEIASNDDAQQVELGVKFRSDTDGYITALRFYKGAGNTGPHVGNLWSADGKLLGRVRFTGETPSGWQQAPLGAPVRIVANTTYVASYHTASGGYAVTKSFFAGSSVERPPLRAPADGPDGGNGVFKYGPSGFPTESFNASNYWVDAVFDTTAPARTLTCPCSIWDNDAVPETPSVGDAQQVELGVKFRSDTDGYITALRFYKGAGNTGPHVGNLWSADGKLLGSAVFSDETPIGWQQASLGAPVRVTAGTTYVASYHTASGGYAVTRAFFETLEPGSTPLSALPVDADGGNGVFKYGPSGFPTESYNATNYWVDAVFATTASDIVPPAIAVRTPKPDASTVEPREPVTVRFSESVSQASIAVSLRTSSGADVPGTTVYDDGTRTATFTPATALTSGTTYTVTVGGATDPAGNTMAPVTWSFTTAAAEAATPATASAGPAGRPELVVSLTLDRGPGAAYYIGETMKLCVFVTRPVRVRVTFSWADANGRLVPIDTFVEGRRCLDVYLHTAITGDKSVIAEALEDDRVASRAEVGLYLGELPD